MSARIFTLSFPLVGTGATTDSYVLANPAPVKCRLLGAAFVDVTGVTANDTNYATLSLELDGVEVASEATTTTDLGSITANTPIAIAVSNPNITAAAGTGKIEAKLAKAASGVAVDGFLVCTFQVARD